MAELLRQQAAGKIRAIGTCNTSCPDLDRYLAGGPVASIQEMYSMIDRQHEKSLFPHANSHGMAVIAYSPMAMGLLTGKLGPEREFSADDNRSWSPRFTVENRQKVAALLDELKPIAAGLSLSLPQLVIRWTASQPTVTHVLCGARSVQQAQENAVGGRGLIDDSILSAIDEILSKHAVKIPHPFLPEDV
jgi:aryl-alcohol dehydrogenase-like predicted oxidoreductase